MAKAHTTKLPSKQAKLKPQKQATQTRGTTAHNDLLSLILRVSVYIAITLTIAVFALIVGYILYSGLPHLNATLFEWKYTTENVSMLPAIINTIIIVVISLLCSAPIAILGAIYLQEYAKPDSWFVGTINMASETLAGIPSIVYGLFGFIVFVIYVFDNTFTMLAKLVVLFRIILPCAVSGVLSGVILSIGRIISESAALLYTSGSVAQVAVAMDSGRTLSVHLYQLLNEGLYINQAAASAVVILLVVIALNLLSNFVAKKFSPPMPA